MKICIIKLGALGDVIRTIPIAIALKKIYPTSEITWITKKSSLEILETVNQIDKLVDLSEEIKETFDLLYNFDIEPEATSLVEKITAGKKFGFCSMGNYPSSLNFASEEYLNTLFDDELKKSNTKTYQELIFQSAEIPYNKEKFNLTLNEESFDYAENFFQKNNLSQKKLIGIHIGSSPRWPSKAWHNENIIEFITLSKNAGHEIILFAGPDDLEKQNQIIEKLKSKNILVHKNNPSNTVLEFASLVNLCNAMICADSFSLHISLALNKPTIGLFFCTSYNELEDYGLLKKIISPKLPEFFPEKMDQYNEDLTKSISAEEVLTTLSKILDRN